jgi:hypothetical protein
MLREKLVKDLPLVFENIKGDNGIVFFKGVFNLKIKINTKIREMKKKKICLSEKKIF